MQWKRLESYSGTRQPWWPVKGGIGPVHPSTLDFNVLRTRRGSGRAWASGGGRES